MSQSDRRSTDNMSGATFEAPPAFPNAVAWAATGLGETIAGANINVCSPPKWTVT